MNIIDGKQSKKVRFIEMILTVSGWLFIVGFTLQIVLSLILWVFNLSNLYQELIIINVTETVNVLLTTLFISILVFVIIYFWGQYNLKNYGNLNRRSFPENVTNEDLNKQFNLSISEIMEYRSSKYILLEENIIKNDT